MRKLTTLGLALLALALIPAAAAFADDDPVATGLAQARSYLEAGQLEAAVETYRVVTRAAPAEGRAWLGLAMALMEKGGRLELVEALQALAAAERQGMSSAFLRFNQACAHAGLGEIDAALGRLEDALAAGFANLAALEGDPDLDPLREEPRFVAVQAEVARRARPCEHDPRYMALDFWIGEWDVFDAQGRQVGENLVQRMVGGCLILENWLSGTGGTGKSVNYFDPGSGRWRQDWVDGSGRVIHYEGAYEDGAMRLTGTLTGPDGIAQASRMTLAPAADGTVRQVIETSADGGGSWQLWFQGEYRRKDAGSEGP